MAKKKTAAQGKRGSSSKRSHQQSPEMDVLQERFNGMELDFHQLASMLVQE